MLEKLVHEARLETLGTEQEITGFGAALMLDGEAFVCAAAVDVPAAQAVSRTLIPTRGTLADNIPLRLLGGPAGARIAVWPPSIFDSLLRSCPWVLDEQRSLSDRFQAFAGATMGHLAELDEASRQFVFDRCDLRVLEEHEVFVKQGAPLTGIAIVGGGLVELVAEGEEEEDATPVHPGHVVFLEAAQNGEAAPRTCRASAVGALLLVLPKAAAEELLAQIPALQGLLAM